MLTVTCMFLIGAVVAAILEMLKKCPQGVATLVVVALIVLPK